MGLFFWNSNQKKTKITLSNLIPREIGNTVMFRCQFTGPNVKLYFSLTWHKCNLHFWHAQNEFPFFVCIPVSTDSSNVHEFKNKIHFVTDFPTAYTKNVGLHLPGNIPFTFTEFFIVSTALTNVPFGIWERRTLHCPDQDIILRTTICKFSLHLLFLIDGTNLHPVTPLPTKRNNKQNKNK